MNSSLVLRKVVLTLVAATVLYASNASAARSFIPLEPTVETAARLSLDAYGPLVGADGFVKWQTVTYMDGFQATIYQKPAMDYYDGNNVGSLGDFLAIAIRGTQLGSDFNTAVKNLLADTSFTSGTPTSLMRSYVREAADVVTFAARNFPEALSITLTGHSLGGAIAEIVGQASNFRTISFDAPGAARLAPKLSSELASVENLNGHFPGEIYSYRLYGDAASLAGAPIGLSITVDPAPIFSKSVIDASSTLLALKLHSMQVLSDQLGNQTPFGDYGDYGDYGVYGGTPLVNGVNLFTPITVIGNVLTFHFQVLSAGLSILIDPPPGLGYEFVEDAGSPFLQSVAMPLLDGVDYWNLSVLQNGNWSAYQTLLSICPEITCTTYTSRRRSRHE